MYKKKVSSLQSATVLPEHEYGEDVANNNDQGLNNSSKYDYNSSYIVHDRSSHWVAEPWMEQAWH